MKRTSLCMLFLPATHPICIFLDFIKVVGKEAAVSWMGGDAPFSVALFRSSLERFLRVCVQSRRAGRTSITGSGARIHNSIVHIFSPHWFVKNPTRNKEAVYIPTFCVLCLHYIHSEHNNEWFQKITYHNQCSPFESNSFSHVWPGSKNYSKN